MIIQELGALDKPLSPCIHVPIAHHVTSLEQDVRAGLLSKPRCLPPKYFYDDRGSRLFDKICDTHEYYPTRTESALLQRYAVSIMEQLDTDYILELGSGTSRKTRHLFNACEALDMQPDYWPFDVCKPMLEETAEDLTGEYDWLSVQPLQGDYSGGLTFLPKPRGQGLYVFLGSSIGNFTESEAQAFVHDIQQHMRKDDYLLLGVDRIKDIDVLEAAYNDSQGITAEFNLNVLNVLNRELQANFMLENYAHQAVFNPVLSQIEMYLVAQQPQQVKFEELDACMQVDAGERILTEISRKYSDQAIRQLIENSGLEEVEHYEPVNGYFSLVLARCC